MRVVPPIPRAVRARLAGRGRLGSPEARRAALPAAQVCIITSITTFIGVTTVVLLSAIRELPLSQWFPVVAFQLSGTIYIGWQLVLLGTSAVKIVLGLVDGEWAVTQRAVIGNSESSIALESLGIKPPKSSSSPFKTAALREPLLNAQTA